MPSTFIYIIGFIAQGFFSARILVQWILSEKQRRVVSPDMYWIFSLAGSILLFTYGWLRNDFSIILGQMISYYIYIWNLNIKGVWHRWHILLRGVIFAMPIMAFVAVFNDAPAFFHRFLNGEVSPWLIVFGSAGQVIFTLRFVYQWYYSHKLGMSVLPVWFWIISLVGSGIIVSYGIFRLDPVLILGQSVGFVAYSRNIMIYHKDKKTSLQEHMRHPTIRLRLLTLAFIMAAMPFEMSAQDERYHGDGIDDVLQYVPIVAATTMRLAGCEGKSKAWDEYVVKAGGGMLLTFAMTATLKKVVHDRRPDGTENNAFPSGHTAAAFAGATVLCKEYGKMSPWIAVGGYAVATVTAVDRVRRNRHNWDDVAVGAALGVACTELSYWIGGKIFPHNKNCSMCVSPTSLTLLCNF